MESAHGFHGTQFKQIFVWRECIQPFGHNIFRGTPDFVLDQAILIKVTSIYRGHIFFTAERSSGRIAIALHNEPFPRVVAN